MAQKPKTGLPNPTAASDTAATIAPATRVYGRVSGQEDLVVAGTVEGQIRLEQTLFVAAEGVVLAEVHVHDAVVAGTVVGNIYAANAIVLTESARVVGNLQAPRVSLEPGAALRGSISMDPPDVDALATNEAHATRSYGQAARTHERAASHETRRATTTTPARAQAAVRLPPRRAQAFTANPVSARPTGPSSADNFRPVTRRSTSTADEKIIIQHPAIRSDERPRRRSDAPAPALPEAPRKKLARPKTLARGKHKVERVD